MKITCSLVRLANEIMVWKVKQIKLNMEINQKELFAFKSFQENQNLL